MKGFIIHPTYKTLGNKAFVYLYGRLENNQSFLTINEFRPYFFIKNSDLKKAQKLDEFRFEETNLINFNSINFLIQIRVYNIKRRRNLPSSSRSNSFRHIDLKTNFLYFNL